MSTTPIIKFEKVAENIFHQAVKTFELKDLVKHRNISQKNLVEMLSRFPGGGQGFKVYRKTWPANMHYIIHHANYKSTRFGNIFGILYSKNKQVDLYPKRLRGTSKRGVWQYEFVSTKDIVLDNGLVYTPEQLKSVAQANRRVDAKQEQAAEQSEQQTEQAEQAEQPAQEQAK